MRIILQKCVNIMNVWLQNNSHDFTVGNMFQPSVNRRWC